MAALKLWDRKLMRCMRLILVCCAGMAPCARAGTGVLGLDHPVAYDNSGIWARKNQTLLLDTMIVGEVGAALWEGGETRFGRTMWQSVDASLVSGLAAVVLKFTFHARDPARPITPTSGLKGAVTRASLAAR